MKLLEILADVQYTCENFQNIEIADIVYDSRKATEGVLFVCLEGAFADGHKYAASAYAAGCRAFVCSKNIQVGDDAIIIKTENTRAALARISCSFFRHPSRELSVIGITGTKGKTTIAHIVKFVLEAAGIKTGIIGTVGASYGDVTLPTVNTTPESYELQKMLRLMADAGCAAAAIEVSSLGLKTHRVDGMQFAFGVFTNLYPDHIGTNEHASFEEYGFWKAQLFTMCKRAVVNIDDPFGKKIAEDFDGELFTYGCDENAEYRLTRCDRARLGALPAVSFEYERGGKKDSYTVSLIGAVNAANSLAAVAIGEAMGLCRTQIAAGLCGVFVKGRGEVVRSDEPYTVIIDYAHNGVSLKNIIDTARGYGPKRIISLFGSVGGRAECRREELGSVSGKYSDFTVITSDDPEYEDPRAICEEIAAYCEGAHVIIPDRAEAIRYAISIAQAGDIVILAGKGHEKFMKVKGEKLPFDERQEVFKAIEMKRRG